MSPLLLLAILVSASLAIWAVVRTLPFGPWAPALTVLIGGGSLLAAGVVPVEVLGLAWPTGLDPSTFAALTALTLVAAQPPMFLAGAVILLIRGRLPPKQRIYTAMVKGGPLQFVSVQTFAVPPMAFLEELAFRAILLGVGLSGDSHPLWVASLVVIAAALPFAAGHVRGGEIQMLGTFLSGIVYGVSFIVTDTIWVPVAAHILHNWFWLAVLRQRYLAETTASNGGPQA
jgi:membrane protease YdiL (CAAX protease family)